MKIYWPFLFWRRRARNEIERLFDYFSDELDETDAARLRRLGKRLSTSWAKAASLADKLEIIDAVSVLRRMARELATDPEEYRDSLGYIQTEGMFGPMAEGSYFWPDDHLKLAYCCLTACNQEQQLGAGTFVQLYRDILPCVVVPRAPDCDDHM